MTELLQFILSTPLNFAGTIVLIFVTAFAISIALAPLHKEGDMYIRTDDDEMCDMVRSLEDDGK